MAKERTMNQIRQTKEYYTGNKPRQVLSDVAGEYYADNSEPVENRCPLDPVEEAKILIVDDEPDILEFLQYNLEKEGFLVVTANDGEEGIEMAERENPNLIILDIMMPIFNGLEVCQTVSSL